MPPKPAPETDDVETVGEMADAEPAANGKGRGAPRSERKAVPIAKTGKKPKGRTIYLSDDLFERIIVQAHRRDKTISEYVSMILERQVPDHRTIRTDLMDDAGAA